MVPPGITRTQAGGFQFRSSSCTLGLMSKVHGVFNNQDAASTSARQSRNTAIDYILETVSWILLSNNLEEDFSLLVLVFLLVMALGKKIVSPNGMTSFKLCV